MSDEEKVNLVRTLSTQAMQSEIAGTELEFFDYLMQFFERQAKQHYYAGYNRAVRDLNGKKQK